MAFHEVSLPARLDPESLSDLRVLGGENAVAVQATGGGWEVVQFRQAALVGDGVWRLGGLLRAQQGTEAEMAAGSPAGATVVFLDPGLPRVDIAVGERGLPLVVRVGPAGAVPGGDGFAEAGFTWTGVHDRPWSPAHLTAVPAADGLHLSWVPRARLDGDRWDGETVGEAVERFRLRILNGGAAVRSLEVAARMALYTVADQTADFPGGLPGGLTAAVAQWSPAFGWGTEAAIAVP
jgi:hypothetical protein